MTIEGRGGPIYSGLSTDTKPTPIEPTALFVETDTAAFFVWDGAAWNSVGGAGAHNFLSATHSDTLAAAAARGNVAVVNSSPAWAAVTPIANAVLASDGIDSFFDVAPQLANIQDTSGNTRITLAAAGDNVTLTGEVAVTGHMDIDGAVGGSEILLSIAPTTAGVTSWQGLQVSPTLTLSGANRFVRGVFGQAIVNIAATTGSKLYGLDFNMAPRVITGVTGTISEAFGLWAHNFAATGGFPAQLTITDLAAGAFQSSASDGSAQLFITNAYGILVKAPGFFGAVGPTVTNYYGMRIFDDTTGKTTNIRLIEIGPATPYLRVVGNFTAAANVTPVHISEGAGPTLRQLQTFDPGAGGVNFVGGELVCLLV